VRYSMIVSRASRKRKRNSFDRLKDQLSNR